jgi:hypothetical protein
MLAHSMTNIQKYPKKDKGDMTIEAMKQALEALENTTPTGFNMERDKQFYAAITALRTAIAEAEKQEPVAWYDSISGWTDFTFYKPHRKPSSPSAKWIPLYTTPPAAPVQEPVALENVYETIIHWDEGGGKRSRRELARRIVDLYTTPPAAQRQPLPAHEIVTMYEESPTSDSDMIAFARAIEAAHGIGEKK